MAADGFEKTIRVGALARVEGEGALHVKVEGGEICDLRLEIYEPPRFFEALLQGRSYLEPVDITARICGICPVAYQMSATHAIEDACGVRVQGPLRDLRRLIYCGEWIESHALHVYMLHAPDFLGYESAIDMAADHGPVVERGLRLKKAGNQVVELVGGRPIHPVNVRVGGFHRAPTRRELLTLREPLVRALEDARTTVRWVAGFGFPDLEVDHEMVALRHRDEYPFNQGRIVSSAGLDLPVADFDRHFQEFQVGHSNALQARRSTGQPYLVGPLARFNLDFEHLSPAIRELAREVGLEPPCRNPFRSIVVRSLEIAHACEEAIKIIEDYREPDAAFVPVEPRAATGHGATEAPRGLLYHRYTLDEQGRITEAVIVPPTSQNQAMIEDDVRSVVREHLEMPVDDLARLCEHAIRNHDPCISCATHFLRLDLVRL